jgi:glycosyltransferase involved in cell wall biosynthesis
MRLSIITVNLNNRDGLQKTIDSVVYQTFKDFEWIVIDGGSTDGSKELIEQYAEHFSYWVSEPDKGIYNAMNKGIKVAKGDYLLFLNSGDVIHASATLEDLDIGAFEADIVSGLAIRKDNGKYLIAHEDNLILQLCWISLNHQATFIKKEVFDLYQYNEGLKIVSDWKFWWDSIVFGERSFKRIDAVVADVEIGGVSMNPQYNSIKNSEREGVLRSFFPPLVLQTFSDFDALRKECKTLKMDNIRYLYENHLGVYMIVRKFVSFVVKLSRRKEKK